MCPCSAPNGRCRNDPANGKSPSSEDGFRYDGKFVPNPKIIGAWKTVGLVDTMEEFAPDKKTDFGHSPLKQVTFKDQSATDYPDWIWSGDMLMNLSRSQALRITPQSIDGTDYLFIESGGFSDRNPSGWQSPLMVMKRGGKRKKRHPITVSNIQPTPTNQS